MPEFQLPNLEELIFDAVVKKFFEPTITYQTQMMYDNATGMQRPNIIPMVDESPLMHVAKRIYENNRDQIADAVGARIEVTELADLVYDRFMDTMKGYGQSITNSAFMKDVQSQVRENVIAEMTSRTIAKLDEEARKAEINLAQAQAQAQEFRCEEPLCSDRTKHLHDALQAQAQSPQGPSGLVQPMGYQPHRHDTGCPPDCGAV